ncbi:MAG TPA: LCP family protein [Thermoleophilia bacterium]|nr:LCP family protein [Thermoleophilia bacterium]
MARQDEDREGAKPYKTYKAGRGRRSQLDDELAGARPARTRPDGDADRGPAYPRQSDKAYHTYGPAPADGRAAGTNKSRGAGAGPRRRRRFRWWYVPVGVFALLVIAGVAATVLAWPGYQKFDRAVDKANKRVDGQTRAQLAADDGWLWRNGTTVALFGLDEAGLPAHSDTILLMHFDAKSHTINQLSIPRDTLVNVEGYGPQKITQAMWYGGPSLALKTLKEYTGIPINHIMVVSFQGFPRLVNSVGGIDMYVPQTVQTEAGSNRRLVTFKKGMHHFDGKNAMLYVRIRKAYAEGDFTRAKRQQAFVDALQKKIVKPSNITRLPDIGRHFMSGVATDLTTNQILELAYLKWRAGGGKKQVLKGELGWSDDGQAVVLPPSDAARQKAVARFLGE